MRDLITAVIPTSPIKSHPKTDIIDRTIRSIRRHLPDIDIVVTFDGVREEQAHLQDDYEMYKSRLDYKRGAPDYKDVWFMDFTYLGHVHQVAMARGVLEWIKTPLVLYVEHDAPLTGLYIDWVKCSNKILDGRADYILFYFKSHIMLEHRHLMIGEPEDDLLRTKLWSQRPHLISKHFFKDILYDNFSKDAKCFIEDKMYDVALEKWPEYGMFVYHPEGDIQRSLHTDGRAGEDKWLEKQIW